METQEPLSRVAIIAVLCLIIGVVGGYFYGNSQGVQKGIASEKARVVAEQKKVADQAAKTANPFGTTSVNPFSTGGSSTVNPYKDVKVNPFQ